MSIHRIYAAISPFFRRRRMRRFRQVIAPAPHDRLLDVGGTADFWEGLGLELSQPITLLNPDPGAADAAAPARFSFVPGDACALPFPDQAFDIVFSNSMIEHLGSWDRQQACAQELRRVGRRLWIQTPAREFFVEPHLIAPFFHWLPRGWQRRLLRNFTVRGWADRPDAGQVEAFLDEVRLLTRTEMRILFPDCTLLRERFLGLTKSYIAVRNLS